jgi:hypothetical protein
MVNDDIYRQVKPSEAKGLVDKYRDK